MNYTFITGASSGLGEAMAELLLEQEHETVFDISRRQTIEHPRYRHIHLDLGDKEKLLGFHFGDFPVSEAKRIVLINNAAVIDPVRYMGEAGTEEIFQAYQVNLIAPALLTNSFLATFAKVPAEKWIIQVSSGAAQRPVDGWAIYCSSKAGLDMLARVINEEQDLRSSGVRCLSIAPGIVDTAMQESIRQVPEEQFSGRERFRRYKQKGELSRPREAAQKVLSVLKQKETNRDVVFRVT